MIKIINIEPHQSVVKEVVCWSCGCTLQYTPNDVKSFVERDYGNGSETVRYIECPNCNADIKGL